MTPVVPFSVSNAGLVPAIPFMSSKTNYLNRSNSLRKTTKQKLPLQKLFVPLSASVGVFPRYKTGFSVHGSRLHTLAATGTEVAVEELDPAVAGKDADGISEVESNALEKSETPSSSASANASATPTVKSKRSRPARKSEMPPVKDEDLVPGATFTGKVRSIQPFGAFVDFGAFTDGLVHVSRLSDSFVKDVGSVVSIGQEVKVRLVESNTENGRISLSMRENDDVSKLQQRKDATATGDKPRTTRRNGTKSNQKRDEVRKSSKFVKGQDLQGTVKSLNRAGAFIALPEGEEGFLPTSEESDEGLADIMGGSMLQVGQEVGVKVLRITRGQVTLTMKKEEDVGSLDSKLIQGVVHEATNPFLLAFRQNKDIAAFLDEREKVQNSDKTTVTPKTKEDIEGKVNQTDLETDIPKVPDQPTSSEEDQDSVPSAVDKVVEDDKTSSEEEGNRVEVASEILDAPSMVPQSGNEDTEGTVSSSSHSVDASKETLLEEDVAPELVTPEASVPSENQIPEVAPVTDELKEDGKSDPAGEMSVDQILSSESVDSEKFIESQVDVALVNDEEQTQAPPAVKNSILSAMSNEHEMEVIKSQPDNVLVNEVETQAPTSVVNEVPPATSNEDEEEVMKSQADDALANAEVQTEAPLTVENEVTLATSNKDEKEAITSQADDALTIDQMQTQAPLTVGNEVPSATSNENESEKLPPTPEKNDNVINSNGQSDSSPQGTSTKATIPPALVKQLREETGAGMMDCKKALAETGGDIVKAQEYLRKKGLASADKKASRVTAEGRIGSYIHDSRIGVLIEVNCETDFVSRGDIFKELVDDLAMQVAACPQVQYINVDDVPEEIVTKEREIEMQKEDLLSKPEQIRSKIVEGRIKKQLGELALLEQPYIKNDKLVVKDWVKQTIATIGENIKVNRFARYNLGEGLEKKTQDFAAEVAAQTAAKSFPAAPEKDKPAAVEAKETVEKPPTVTVSAALVKQLREETGAGMMDCKRALAETGGNLGKAQEYLRKKGLSTADKKSSRLAVEGRIGSYIHDSRIGVLIEVNCETDFVGRSEKFKELVEDLAMQVVACPQVQFVSIEDIPESMVNKEKELEMQREDLLSKPENIREKIVEGRVSKRLGELVLLEQPFIKNDSLLVKDLVKQTVAALGENIKVRRFARFTLGDASKNGQTAT
ncbi:polyprotein of EF-Ts, chloroplastic [Macadamia integrifolia]|uniref:polyprotein of EF-Ts, chloroplastic n=1 Tax=Macadamia integrifolia TaxID=60698 RepID=UPI001C52BBE2|nr:polyprotein of EF-Ts, chloroplastic [Macadamia integrifolia]